MKIDRIINKKYSKTFLSMCSGVNKIDCITYKKLFICVAN